MYRFADRFPVSQTASAGAVSPVPWGLSRLEPYGSFDLVEDVPAGLDPTTQRGLYQLPNGTIVMSPGKHSRSRQGTEKSTKTGNRGDGSKARPDTDHSQDTKLD
ncbi:putative ATP-grasp-modified RiPP [Streptomyces sp. SID13031]|uniref:putative ATP-grasp-modified RiPP n=1 Tax=Streptomyces sp. SID13031 TaxID=2706046 RepID=UPI0013C90728|nr:putative ATP-grasp-modified RiPP [Streptomyces sp. SID13031]NEA35135.1 putative ATP-grasp-modified RiPP [Streptomyces sp. SID13031]